MSAACKWVPVIEAEACTGCRNCLEACDRNCLETSWGVAVLTDPNYCGSDGECVRACPEDAMSMQWVPVAGNHTIGRWDHDWNAEGVDA